MKKMIKTNAMRMLDRANIPYQIHTYEHKEGLPVDGKHVAELLHQDVNRVFKTLVTQASCHQYYVFVIPVEEELDLKACAALVHEKSIAMIHVKDLQKISGYVRGGCSPIGMKKQFSTILHDTCLNYETIYFSAGRIGCQIEASPNDVITLLHAAVGTITRTLTMHD